jgi:signal transduction histidine kinase
MTPGASEATPDYRVLLLPPTRRDGEVTRRVLERAGLQCEVCAHPLELAREIRVGMGAVVLTDALGTHPLAQEVLTALSEQPPWSDAPAIVLSASGRNAAATSRLLASLTNVTVLDRPTSARSLVSAVQTAIRGRGRQYQIRDQLAALMQAEETLRTADRRKDEFLAMLAHELRNPLAPIRNANELLARTVPQDARARISVDIIKRQLTHLTRLVDDLLDVSRVTQGRIQLQVEALELAAIVAQALESVEPQLRERRHNVTRTTAAEPLYVNGDSARLVQCVANLLTNATKYTDPGGELQVGLRKEDSCAVISVADNGIGIPPDLLPKVFELFVQSERSLDRSEGGLGIGLSVVQRLVAMHGGEVAAASPGAGRGSTFEIRLPLVEPPRQLTRSAVPSRIEPKRLLVVDDNEDAATSLAELLRLDGHEALAVYSARAALAAVADFKPDVMLLDIGLPEMDGYEVARRVRAAGSRVRLVALTGYGQTEDMQRTFAAGFDAHFVKPLDLLALEQLVAGESGSARARF